MSNARVSLGGHVLETGHGEMRARFEEPTRSSGGILRVELSFRRLNGPRVFDRWLYSGETKQGFEAELVNPEHDDLGQDDFEPGDRDETYHLMSARVSGYKLMTADDGEEVEVLQIEESQKYQKQRGDGDPRTCYPGRIMTGKG